MSEKDVIIREKVKHGGILDFRGLYNYAYEWLMNEKYNITEEKYQEKVSGNSKELEIVWVATRKITDYFKIQLDIKWRVLALTDVEVEIDGKKKKMNSARDTEIGTKGTLIKDYQSTWESSSFSKFIRELYNKYIIPNRTDQMEGKVIDDVQTFNAEIKAFLDLTGKK